MTCLIQILPADLYPQDMMIWVSLTVWEEMIMPLVLTGLILMISLDLILFDGRLSRAMHKLVSRNRKPSTSDSDDSGVDA